MQLLTLPRLFRPASYSHPRQLLTSALFAGLLQLIFPLTAAAGMSPWVDLRIDQGALLLDTSIAGIDGYALIDTGSQVNAINRRFLAANSLDFKQGPLMRIKGVNGAENRRTYVSVPVDILDHTINFRKLVDLRLGPPDLQMVLGAGFLSLYVFQFDYPNRRMRILTRDAVNLKKLKNVPSRRDAYSGQPMVKVRLDNRKDVWLVVDTGDTGGILLDRAVATQMGWTKGENIQKAQASGAFSVNEVETFTIDSLAIGGMEIGNPTIVVPPKNKPFEMFKRKSHTGTNLRTRPSKWQGLLGYDVLKHFLVTIDYKGGHVHLEPGSVEKSPASATQTTGTE